MMNVYSVQKIRQLEQYWAQDHSGSTWGLMQAAAQSFVRQYLQALSPGPVLVLVGSGNNGGDGYLIAKLLREAGLKVSVVALLGAPAVELDAHKAREQYLSSGGEIEDSYPDKTYPAIIDALFGIGLSRPIEGELAEVINAINQSMTPVYAVDIPSGLDARTGQILSVAVAAKATHTFIGYKPGLLTHNGPSLCGQLSVDTLNIVSDSDWQRDVAPGPLPPRRGNTHKAEHGDLRIIGGRLHMAGAALIAGRAALNAGAG